MNKPFNSILTGIATLLAWAGPGRAAVIPVPNASFESPTTFYATPDFDSWQKTPKPDWYVEEGGFYWSYHLGVFKNTVASSTNHIDNCDGNQALWLFAVPEVTLFQDYDSVDWNDASPTHAFDARYEVGKSYRLTVAVIGTGGGMLEGATLELSLYYRDAASNRTPVAVTSLTNTPSVFSNNTHFIDCVVDVPVVTADDAWADQNIGIQFRSTVSPELQGGYWDLDHARLVSNRPPVIASPTLANNQFRFTLRSEPGLVFEIFATTNFALPPSVWTSLGTLTNVTGTIPFIDTSANSDRRFYQARQLP
jgi:hypothetical protein